MLDLSFNGDLERRINLAYETNYSSQLSPAGNMTETIWRIWISWAPKLIPRRKWKGNRNGKEIALDTDLPLWGLWSYWVLFRWLFHASYLKYDFLNTCYPLGICKVFVHAQKSLKKLQNVYKRQETSATNCKLMQTRNGLRFKLQLTNFVSFRWKKLRNEHSTTRKHCSKSLFEWVHIDSTKNISSYKLQWLTRISLALKTWYVHM